MLEISGTTRAATIGLVPFPLAVGSSGFYVSLTANPKPEDADRR